MIYHAIDEAFRFGHDLPLLRCLHVPDSPDAGTSEPPRRPVTPPTGEARRLDEDARAWPSGTLTHRAGLLGLGRGLALGKGAAWR
jgi:hypothetical protein